MRTRLIAAKTTYKDKDKSLLKKLYSIEWKLDKILNYLNLN